MNVSWFQYFWPSQLQKEIVNSETRKVLLENIPRLEENIQMFEEMLKNPRESTMKRAEITEKA